MVVVQEVIAENSNRVAAAAELRPWTQLPAANFLALLRNPVQPGIA